MMAILGDGGNAGDVGADDVGTDDGSLEYADDADDARLSERSDARRSGGAEMPALPAVPAAPPARAGDAAALTLAKEAARDKFSKFCCKFCSVNLEGRSNTAKLLTGGSTTDDIRGILWTMGSGMGATGGWARWV